MLRFIIKRLLVTIPTILVVITITWGLVRLAPGNFYSGEKKLPAAIEKNIREKYGLDKPWYQQYGRTMWGILRHLDFGTSLKYQGQSVNTIIRRSLPVSAGVGILAYLLALIVGIPIGSFAALKQNSRWDYGSMALTMLGISIPNFVLGPILVLIFSLSLYWLPPSRWDGFLSRSIILPVITLSAVYMSYIARLTRAGMLEVLRSDYIRTARAKGLSERDVVIRHALRGGLMPVHFLHRTRSCFSSDWYGGCRKDLRATGPRQLFYSSLSKSRRTSCDRDRRLYRDYSLVDESTG